MISRYSLAVGIAPVTCDAVPPGDDIIDNGLTALFIIVDDENILFILNDSADSTNTAKATTKVKMFMDNCMLINTS